MPMDQRSICLHGNINRNNLSGYMGYIFLVFEL